MANNHTIVYEFTKKKKKKPCDLHGHTTPFDLIREDFFNKATRTCCHFIRLPCVVVIVGRCTTAVKEAS